MNPETPEGRTGRLEERMARLEQRVDGVSDDLLELAPVRERLTELKGEIAAVRYEVHQCSERVAELRRKVDERERQRRQEERDAQKDADEKRAAELRDDRNSRRALHAGMVLVVFTTVGTFVVQLLLQA